MSRPVNLLKTGKTIIIRTVKSIFTRPGKFFIGTGKSINKGWQNFLPGLVTQFWQGWNIYFLLVLLANHFLPGLAKLILLGLVNLFLPRLSNLLKSGENDFYQGWWTWMVDRP